MKIFLSHQRSDTAVAHRIRDRLKTQHNIESYLDVIDAQLDKAGDDLARHLRREIAKCSHLIAVTSYATRDSQWVPWEIGVATERLMPLATFADYKSAIPEFLEAWPYLRDQTDIDRYATSAKVNRRFASLAKSDIERRRLQETEFKSFYNDLRRSLGQPILRAR